MYVIFRLLLSILHLSYSFYYFIQQNCIWLILTIKQCHHLNKTNYNYTLNAENHSITISKIPRHLAILLGQEEISILDLIKLISWCIIAEIPYVSFYDHKGILQKNQNLFKKKLNELEPFINQNIEWFSYSNKIINNSNINTQKNDKTLTNFTYDDAINIDKYKIRIQVLSYVDGKSKIVSLTKILAKVTDTTFCEKEITTELLDEKLNFNLQIPDPELAIVFGKTMCNYGFLPWQSRITEFFIIPSHHNISCDNFKKILIKFAECQQRYGK